MVKSDGFVIGRRGALRVLGCVAAGLGVGASVQAQTAGGAGGLGGSALQAVGRLFSRPQGNLLIVGGGDTPLSVQQRFVALAGGPENARIAVLPMASSQSDEEAQEVVLDHPQLIGVGIDEETALLVRADGQWEVLGNYYVKIFDARRAQIVDDRGPMAKAADIRMHVLPEGGLFDPRRRRVEFQEVNIP